MLRRADWNIVTGVSKNRRCLRPGKESKTFETPVTWRNIPELLNPQNCCGKKPKSCSHKWL